MLCEQQDQSSPYGEEKSLLSLPGIEPRCPGLLAYRIIGWAISAPVLFL
jgi:hypothetical protein